MRHSGPDIVGFGLGLANIASQSIHNAAMSEEWRQQLLTSLAIQFNEVKYPLYVQSILNLKYYAPLQYIGNA